MQQPHGIRGNGDALPVANGILAHGRPGTAAERWVQPGAKIKVSATDAMSAAKATVSDMGSFCDRQRDACSIGSQAAVALGYRAQAAEKLLYEYLNEHFGARDAAVPASLAGKTLPTPATGSSQHTLLPADLIPPWRGPQPPQQVRG